MDEDMFVPVSLLGSGPSRSMATNYSVPVGGNSRRSFLRYINVPLVIVN